MQLPFFLNNFKKKKHTRLSQFTIPIYIYLYKIYLYKDPYGIWIIKPPNKNMTPSHDERQQVFGSPSAVDIGYDEETKVDLQICY